MVCALHQTEIEKLLRTAERGQCDGDRRCRTPPAVLAVLRWRPRRPRPRAPLPASEDERHAILRRPHRTVLPHHEELLEPPPVEERRRCH